jgi:hypothetical protein
MANKDVQIGKIVHYFDKIGVAVIAMTKQSLSLGDTVKISGHDKEFTQTVISLQVEHEQVKRLAKGKEGAMKVDQAVREDDIIYSVPTK